MRTIRNWITRQRARLEMSVGAGMDYVLLITRQRERSGIQYGFLKGDASCMVWGGSRMPVSALKRREIAVAEIDALLKWLYQLSEDEELFSDNRMEDRVLDSIVVTSIDRQYPLHIKVYQGPDTSATMSARIREMLHCCENLASTGVFDRTDAANDGER